MNDTTKLKYLRMLSHTDVDQQRTAILELGKLDDPYIYKILISHFFDAQPALRDALYLVFTARPKRWIAEMVADTLLSPQLSVRSLATDILKNYDKEAIWPLKRLMKSPNPEVRKSAAEILGTIADPRAAEILYNHLDDDNENVVIAIIEGLGQQNEIRAVPVLVKLLKEENPYHAVIINALLNTLSYWQNELFSADFLAEEEFIHYAALDAVRQSGNAAGLDKIIALMFNSPNDHFLFEAVETLSAILQMQPDLVLPGKIHSIFEKLQQNKTLNIHLSAFLNCLSRIASRRSLNLLIDNLKDEKWRSETQTAIAGFANNFPDLFFDYYMMIPSNIRMAILEGIVENGDRIQLDWVSIQEIFDLCLDSRERILLLRLLADPNNEKLVEFAEKEIGLPKNDVHTRYEVASAFEHPTFLPVFYQALTSTDVDVQHGALNSLIKFESKAVEYLVRKSREESPEVWPFLVSVVAAFPLKQVTDFWREFWKEKSDDKLQLLTAYINQPAAGRVVPAILTALLADEKAFQAVCETLCSKNFNWDTSPEFFQWLASLEPEKQQELEKRLLKFGLELPQVKLPEEANQSVSVTEDAEHQSTGSWN